MIARFFTLATWLLLKVWLRNPVNLLKFAILFAMWHRREYFIEHYIGWNEDNDFIGVNFVISVRSIQIVIAIFSEKYNDGYNYDAKTRIFRSVSRKYLSLLDIIASRATDLQWNASGHFCIEAPLDRLFLCSSCLL